MKGLCNRLMEKTKILKRILYLGYYLKQLDKKKFKTFSNYVVTYKGFSKVRLLKDIFFSIIRHNISILDYFYFHFYELLEDERSTYAGTGYMYEYQLLMNYKKARKVLENKLLFLKEYQPFIRHKFYNLRKFSPQELTELIKTENFTKIVLKSSDGQCGEGIEVITVDTSNQSLEKKLETTGNDLLEEFIVQHDDLMRLSPSGLNTVRIFTQLNKNDEVEILGARLRITIDSYVDNLAAGNIAAPINEKTGIVEGPGVYSDITKQDEFKHPVTNVKIVGFQIPYWKESMKMVKEAALLHTENRSIGWDVAITNEGPELLEGNHNWCKLLWQLPVKKGLKSKLEQYI